MGRMVRSDSISNKDSRLNVHTGWAYGAPSQMIKRIRKDIFFQDKAVEA
jgi:hypothetical protein